MRNPSELWSITCHMGSQSVTCHLTQVNVPCHNHSQSGQYFVVLQPGQVHIECQYIKTISTHHLNGSDILLLFNIDMSNVQPNIAKVCRCFTHLGEYITSLVDVTLVS